MAVGGTGISVEGGGPTTTGVSSEIAMLDNIVTMDETMVCHHTPETKKQSMQRVKKGQPGPLKARVHASRTKQMLLTFFDNKGVIYSHIVP
jgi:histone-lysine N-methyltransferase SETMAR